jgi:hypothetical protein
MTGSHKKCDKITYCDSGHKFPILDIPELAANSLQNYLKLISKRGKKI